MDADVEAAAANEGIALLSSGKKDNSGKKPSDKPTGSDVKKTSTVVKQFVVDYTIETFEPLMEHEVNGLDYRYVYGNDRLSVNITGVENGSSKLIENGNQIRLYYHMDYLGTADYLTSPLTGKVESWTHYNEWGEITHNAVLKCGQRELDLVKRYATHDFDAVLNLYYAKARFYDAENRHFTAMDAIKGTIMVPQTMVQYLYVRNNPLRYIDMLGLLGYDALNVLGFGLAMGAIPHEFAFVSVMLSNANPWLAGHQLAQVFAYKWLKRNGFSLITLEMTNPSGKRVDVVAQTGSTVSLFEIKHRTAPHYEEYQHAKDVLLGAQQQLQGYFEELQCELLDGYTLAIQDLSGRTRYKLFSLNFPTSKVTSYINLRHQPHGVIEYWFSTETQKRNKITEREVYPAYIVNEYQNYSIAKTMQKQTYAAISGVSTALMVTAGLVVGGVAIGVTVYAVTPTIASWMATAATNITIATTAAAGAASQIVYQAGQAIYSKSIQQHLALLGYPFYQNSLIFSEVRGSTLASLILKEYYVMYFEYNESTMPIFDITFDEKGKASTYKPAGLYVRPSKSAGAQSYMPIPYRVMQNVSSISVCIHQNAAIDFNNTLWTWGARFMAQIEGGAYSNDVPQDVEFRPKGIGKCFNGKLWCLAHIVHHKR